MKLNFEHALQMLEANGRPSLFRIMLQPIQPVIKHMDAPSEEPVLDEQVKPEVVQETARPEIVIPLVKYELYTLTVLKKWWRTLSCSGCKTDAVGFKPTPKRPA